MALKEVCGLWRSDDGKAISGQVKEEIAGIPAGIRFFVYPNEHKTPGSKAPDYRLKIVVPDEDDSQAPAAPARKATQPGLPF